MIEIATFCFCQKKKHIYIEHELLPLTAIPIRRQLQFIQLQLQIKIFLLQSGNRLSNWESEKCLARRKQETRRARRVLVELRECCCCLGSPFAAAAAANPTTGSSLEFEVEKVFAWPWKSVGWASLAAWLTFLYNIWHQLFRWQRCTKHFVKAVCEILKIKKSRTERNIDTCSNRTISERVILQSCPLRSTPCRLLTPICIHCSRDVWSAIFSERSLFWCVFSHASRWTFWTTFETHVWFHHEINGNARIGDGKRALQVVVCFSGTMI